MATKKQKERQEAIEQLRQWIKPGDTINTILRHVSRSGMSRNISVVLIQPDGSTLHPNYSVAKATDNPLVTGFNDAVKIGGCGMDMGFALVYSLSHALYPEYDCLGEGKCPSADHSNARHTGEPCPTRHKDGYALRQRWL